MVSCTTGRHWLEGGPRSRGEREGCMCHKSNWKKDEDLGTATLTGKNGGGDNTVDEVW
jgi:hypothetical protein